jgi:hypothetical protein
MGVGAILVPGSNDTLVLYAIVGLSPNAVPAYLIMVIRGTLAEMPLPRRADPEGCRGLSFQDGGNTAARVRTAAPRALPPLVGIDDGRSGRRSFGASTALPKRPDSIWPSGEPVGLDIGKTEGGTWPGEGCTRECRRRVHAPAVPP